MSEENTVDRVFRRIEQDVERILGPVNRVHGVSLIRSSKKARLCSWPTRCVVVSLRLTLWKG